MFHGPARGGTRGGQALFNWENVKNDKYRESYIGHSINAPLGRWQKNKDLQWYTKDYEKKGPENQDEYKREINKVKDLELEALTALISKGNSSGKKSAISEADAKSLLKSEKLGSANGKFGVGYLSAQLTGGLKQDASEKEILQGTADATQEGRQSIPRETFNRDAHCSTRHVHRSTHHVHRSTHHGTHRKHNKKRAKV